MRTRLVGAVLVSVWGGLNLLLASGIVVAIVALGRPPPSLVLFVSAEQLAQTPAQAIALIHALAVFGNACAAAASALSLFVVWRGVMAGARWALPALAAVLVPLQLCGFASDAFLGHSSWGANLASSVILGVGLGLCAWAGPAEAPAR